MTAPPAEARPQEAEERAFAHQLRPVQWVIGILIVGVVLAGAVLGALREPARLAPGTPEAVVQAYLAAVLEGDYLEAVTYLVAESAERCGVAAFHRSGVPESLTATLRDVRVGDRQADVTVRLRSAPGPFGAGDYAFDERFLLVPDEGNWRIAGDPWPLFECQKLP